MLQRNSSSLRARASVLTGAIVLFGVVPHHVIAQAARPAMTPAAVTTMPVSSIPPPPPSPVTAVVLAAPPPPPAPPIPPHPASNGSDHAHVLTDDNILNVGAEYPRAPKLQRREQQIPDNSKRQEPGRQQWARSERLRVANEAARREADRMIDAASPMEWRNRYSSD